MFQLFQNENLVRGLAEDSPFQVGISDLDPGAVLEQGVTIPWMSDASASFVYYDCWITSYLDPGIVVHRHLPQANPSLPDSLGVTTLNDGSADKYEDDGVNTKSKDSFNDIVQRMAHSQYWFCLRGLALRIGKQVPIPKILLICGQVAVPHYPPEMAYNKIVGNYSGIPLWKAEWALWYTTSVQPRYNVVPPTNLAAHIRADQQLPDELQAPFSQPDPNAQPAEPPGLQNPIGG